MSDTNSPMLVGRYEKFHVFAMSCWNGIPNSCNNLIKIWHFMRIYGSLKPQMVTINWLVAKYAKQHFKCDWNDNVPSL